MRREIEMDLLNIESPTSFDDTDFGSRFYQASLYGRMREVPE